MIVVYSKCHDHTNHPIILQLPPATKHRAEPQPSAVVRLKEEPGSRCKELNRKEAEELAHDTTLINSLLSSKLDSQRTAQIDRACAVHLCKRVAQQILATHAEHEVEGCGVSSYTAKHQSCLWPDHLLLRQSLPEHVFHLKHPLLESNGNQVRMRHEGAEPSRKHTCSVGPPRLIDDLCRRDLMKLCVLLEKPELHLWWDCTLSQ
mmetsp:Transcript_24657/g.46796  ORF Transcript_24657/g.46796 Transcript_24657/m.46796 type:complete len:205 (-) Transcript_24657:411-1025(-)